MFIFSMLVLVFGHFLGSHALSCMACNKTMCADVDCPGSKVLDACACCDTCAKQMMEPCGGPWGVSGTCDHGMACTEPQPMAGDYARSLFIPSPFVQFMGHCEQSYKDCNEVCEHTNDTNNRPSGFTYFGRAAVLKDEDTGRGYRTYCDCSSGEGRAWMVIQRRSNFRESFDRTWAEYEDGFGLSTGNFWLGLKRLYKITQAVPHEMKIYVKFDKSYTSKTHYRIAVVDGPDTSYTLTVGLNTGEESNEFVRIHNGMPFSTKDRDNDNWTAGDCAKWFRGGWWYNSCSDFNLNGVHYVDTPHTPGPDRITWGGYMSGPVEMVEMKVRPLVLT